MDLQDFESQLLYFDKPMRVETERLIEAAAEAYGEGNAEPLLLEAYTLEPENLSVLVALYRFYYYQHRYPEGVAIAQEVMGVVAPMIHFPERWEEIEFAHLANGVQESFTMVRFYLLALKAQAYLQLRMENVELGVKMLNKVIELDNKDRLGARSLLLAVGPTELRNNSDQQLKYSVLAD